MVDRLVRKCSAKYADIRGENNLDDRKELQKDVNMKNTFNEESELMRWFNRDHIDEVIEDFLNGVDYSSDKEDFYGRVV